MKNVLMLKWGEYLREEQHAYCKRINENSVSKKGDDEEERKQRQLENVMKRNELHQKWHKPSIKQWYKQANNQTN